MTSNFGHHFAQRHWYRLSPLSLVLLPAAALFGMAVVMRRALYRCGILTSVRLGVPVVVVGNLVAGGTGKTPLVLWIAERLRAAGRRPGIVLRGYGGKREREQAVSVTSDVRYCGDEALLLAQRSACPVWTGRNRAAAARALLAEHPECDLIVCDDGLQHYRLSRDLELAVEDERGHGNGLLLPAGPLREPASRRVDATIVNGGRQARRPGRIFGMQLKPAGLERLDGVAIEAESLKARRLHAVAGIGNPQRFFDTLTALGLKFSPHAFPDHHVYSSADLDFPDCDFVLMTEKDAVKCRSFGRGDLFMLRVVAEPDPAFADFLLTAINGRETA